jgi:hypothetical protein
MINSFFFCHKNDRFMIENMIKYKIVIMMLDGDIWEK